MSYTQLGRLGEGFFGEVWHERDDSLDRECAAKYLDPAKLAEAADPFAEAKMMIDAEHDHVVKLYSADWESGQPVIRMEYLPDGSVGDHFAGAPIAPAEAVAMLEDACRGVEHLHSRGLLHRDLKPANLLLAPTGVKVSDFGLACRQGSTEHASAMRYEMHAPPEVLEAGSAIETVEGDLWALGMTGYRLLCGDDVVSEAFNAASDFTAAVIAGKFPPRDKFPIYVHDGLRRAVLAALHRNPDKRLKSAAEFRHRLEKARPWISWKAASEDPDAWTGIGEDETRWVVAMKQRPRRGWETSVRRALPGKAWRRVGADCCKCDDVVEARKHAGAVMRRLAETGE